MRKVKGIDAATYEVLAAAYQKADMAVRAENVGAYRTKTTKAGDFLYVYCYPLIATSAIREQRRALDDLRKGRAPFSARVKYARYNNKRRMLYVEQLAHANFGIGSFHVTLTYERQDYDIRNDRDPLIFRTRDEAKRELTNWFARVKRLLKRHGVDLAKFKWLRVTVTKEGNKEGEQQPDRHHHHVLLDGVPEELRGEIERLWPYGFCNADRLQPGRNDGIARVAQYVARQEGAANGSHQANERSWTCSKNLARPKVTVSDSRISRRRVMQIAADVRRDGRDILEAIYPGYRTTQDDIEVTVSDFCAGAYIRARLRRIEQEDGRRKEGVA